MGLAVLAAVVTAAAPWVARPWRRAAWTFVLIATFTRILAAPIQFDTVVAVLTGWTAGAAVVVAFGAPSRRPTGRVHRGRVWLPSVFRSHDWNRPARRPRLDAVLRRRARTGRALFVKALGADERSADLLFRLYRAVQPRDLGDERPFSSLRRAVEHEALVALAARDLGHPHARASSRSPPPSPNGFVLAYEAIAGRSLDRARA